MLSLESSESCIVCKSSESSESCIVGPGNICIRLDASEIDLNMLRGNIQNILTNPRPRNLHMLRIRIQKMGSLGEGQDQPFPKLFLHQKYQALLPSAPLWNVPGRCSSDLNPSPRAACAATPASSPAAPGYSLQGGAVGGGCSGWVFGYSLQGCSIM